MRSIVVLIALFATSTQAADFKKISTFSEIKIEYLSPKSLVVSDINDTLATCSEPLWQKSTQKALPNDLQTDLQALTPAGKNYLANLVLTKCSNRELGGSAQFFANLAAAKKQNIALTAAFPNQLDHTLMREHVAGELKRLGITFLPPKSKSFELETLAADKVSKVKPSFTAEGILILLEPRTPKVKC